MTTISAQNTEQKTTVKRGAARWLLRETLGNLMLIAILFGIVGRWDWWAGWALVAIYIIWTTATAILILPVNPAMLAERSRPKKDTKKWDMVLLGIMAVLFIGEYVIASLDVRWTWSPPLPSLLRLAGMIAAFVGYDLLFVWAMVSNAFFVSTVRIQTDRGHAVSSRGPYRYVRHPGYVGALLLHLGVPFMLNSLWALIPAFLILLVFIVRTSLEDRTLQTELPGYKEYAERVRYRLLPGVW